MNEISDMDCLWYSLSTEEKRELFDRAGYDDYIPSSLFDSFAITLLGGKDLSKIKTKKEFKDYFALYCNTDYPTYFKAMERCQKKGITNPSDDDLLTAFDELYEESDLPLSYPNPRHDGEKSASTHTSKAKGFRDRIKVALGFDNKPASSRSHQSPSQDSREEER